MSIFRQSMQQVPEIAHVASDAHRQPLECARVLLHCGILLLLAIIGGGCDSKKNGNGALQQATVSHESPQARVLRRGLPGDPRTLDPQQADDDFSFQVVRDIYEGLTAEDSHGGVVPGVASSWSVDNTGTIYTFQLRPNAKWSDGRRTTADEFVLGLRRAVDPHTASGSAALLEVIKGASAIIAGRKSVNDLGVTAIGESTVRIELEHPAPFVLQILSQPIAAPLHIEIQPPAGTDQSQVSVRVSNGAYTLVTRVPGSFIELARNQNYWDAAHVLIERVRYINAESEATELREYIANQLDMTFTIPMPDLSRISEDYGKEVQVAPILGTIYLELNVLQPPLRDSRDLRQALSMAIDRDLISAHVIQGVAPAYSYVAKGISGYSLPTYAWASWTRDRQLAYARLLYTRSGYSEGRPLHLRMYFNSNEGIQRTMVAIASNWKQNLGITTDLVSEEFRVFLTDRKDRHRWDIARLGWQADYDDPASFLEVFSRNNGENDSGYNSVQFNELLDAARVEPQPDARIALLQKSERVLLEDYPIIPLYFYEARRLVKPYLGGAEITPLNRTYSKHLYWKPDI
jgi:oligopeptide transport system substrate-binding protein